MNFNETQSASPLEILSNIKTTFTRYWRLSLPPALAVFVLVALVSIRLPSYFTSDFSVYVQPQQIQSNLLDNSTKKEESEKFDALIQELISRERLLKIIQRLNLYPNLKGISKQDEAIKKFQKAYALQTLQSLISKSQDSSPSFRVSFSHQNRDLAYNVATELQNALVQESLISVRSETQGTEEFFNSQLKDVEHRLQDIEKKRQDYMSRNAGKLPEQRERAITDHRELSGRISTNSQIILQNKGRISYLEQDFQVASRDTSGSVSESNLDDLGSLSSQKQALSILKSKYSDKHPEVLAVQKRIETLEARGAGSSSTSKGPARSSSNSNREGRVIKREINELQVRNTALTNENELNKKRLEELDKVIRSIPIKEVELIEIERDYETTRLIYDKLVMERERSAIQANLIQSQRGSRFRIIEPPRKAEEPAGPDRILIFLGGFIFGLIVFLGVPVAFYFFNGAFKSKKDVEATFNELPILGLIPPLNTSGSREQRRKLILTSLYSSIGVTIFGILVILLAI